MKSYMSTLSVGTIGGKENKKKTSTKTLTKYDILYGKYNK